MIDVCICTHNPRNEVLARVVAALANQDVAPESFRVIVVDNASSTPLVENIIAPLIDNGIEAKLVTEPMPGLQRARIAAYAHCFSDWVLWVDDDNELSSNFIRTGLEFMDSHPEVGCFGGKLLLPPGVKYKNWLEPFLPYLGIKNLDHGLTIESVDRWTIAEPAGAGAWVHRKVLEQYIACSKAEKNFFKLGRTGQIGLASCDDSIMMRGAFRCGMSCAYVPALQLRHHIDLFKRSRFIYLIRLMYAYGVSHVLLETMLNGPQPIPEYYSSRSLFLKTLLYAGKSAANQSLAFGIGIAAYHLGARAEHFRQNQVKP